MATTPVPNTLKGIVKENANMFEPAPEPTPEPTIEQGVGGGLRAVSAPPPSWGQKAGALARGITEGGIEGSTILGSTLGWAKIGGQVPIPQLKPLGATLGGLGGFAYGLYASDAMKELFGYGGQEEYPSGVGQHELQTWREAGKTFGSGMAFAPGSLAFPVAKAGAGAVRSAISAIGEFARRNPKAYLGKEALANMYAAMAGGAIYGYDPEASGARLTGEMVAGLFGPTKFIGDVKSILEPRLQAVRSGLSGSGTENRVATYLQTLIAEAGEDPEKLIKLLQKPLPEVGGLRPTPTAAQKSGSAKLGALERTLVNTSAEFGGLTRAQAENTMGAYQKLIDMLSASGDPDLLRKAAILRQQLYQDTFNSALAKAQVDAADAASRVTNAQRAGSDARKAVGDILQTQIEGVLTKARDQEKSLWKKAMESLVRTEKPMAPAERQKMMRLHAKALDTKSWTEAAVKQAREDFMRLYGADPRTVDPSTLGLGGPKMIQIPASNLRTAFLDVTSEITPERLRNEFKSVYAAMQRLGLSDSVISQWRDAKLNPELMKKLQDEIAGAAAGAELKSVRGDDLVNIRSDLLDAARASAAKGENGAARIFGLLANAALEDLGSIKSNAFDAARQFSRELNNAFTRTFAGKIDDVAGTGAEKLPAEVLVQKAFQSGKDETVLRMQQLQDAAAFLDPDYRKVVEEYGRDSVQAQRVRPAPVASVRDAQARALKLMAAETVERTTDVNGNVLYRVNAKSFDRFMTKNRDILKGLGLWDEMQTVADAERRVLDINDQGSAFMKQVNADIALSKLISHDSPVRAVSDILNSKQPISGLKSLVEMAKKEANSDQLMEAIKSAVYQHAFMKAGGDKGFDPQKFLDVWFKGPTKNDPSLVNMMRSAGLMNFGEVANLRRLIEPMFRVQQALTGIPRGAKRAGAKTLDSVEPMGAESGIEDLATRLLGSRLGSALTSITGGKSSLVLQAGAVRYVQRALRLMPTQQAILLLRKAASDPDLMAALLQRGLDQQQQRMLGINLLSRLYSPAAMRSAVAQYLDREKDEVEQEEPATTPAPPRPPRPAPQAPATRTSPTPRPAAPAAAAPTTTGQAPAGMSQSLAMMAQLFPNDPTVATLIARQQGA